jgi:hypothetical protein
MKLRYYPETDSLYIELNSAPGAEVREIVEGLVVDLDANGDVAGSTSSTLRRSWICRRWRPSRCRRRARRSDVAVTSQ